MPIIVLFVNQFISLWVYWFISLGWTLDLLLWWTWF